MNGIYIDITKHSVSSDAYIRIPPVNIGNGLMLVTESNSIVLTMSNMYLTWVWLRWLRAALKHWDKGFKHDDWILEHELSAELTVSVKQSKKCIEKAEGRCQLSLSSPHILKFEGVSLDFSTIKGIILATDSREYEPAYVNIEITPTIINNIDSNIYDSYFFLKAPSGSQSSEPTNSKTSSQTFSIDLPRGHHHGGHHQDDGIYIAYYEGLCSMENEQGQGFLPFSALLPPLEQTSSTTLTTQSSLTIDLNDSFKFKITVNKATGLKFSSGGPKNLYVRCRAVEWNGDKASKSFIDDGSLRNSKTVEAGPSVSWNDTFNINFGSKLVNTSDSEYFRLELFVNEIGILSDVKVGAVLVPFWRFKNKAEMITAPILNFRNSISLCSVTSNDYNDQGLGSLNFVIQRVTESNGSSLKVNAKFTTINERSLYFNKWSADCLMSGSMNSDVIAEPVLIDLNHSGLIITIISEYDYNNGKANTNSSTDVNNNNSKPKKKRIALCGCYSTSAVPGTNEPSTIRGRAFVANPASIVMLCKQRTNLESDVFTIEWDKVQTFNIISENILSLTFNVDKYFGEENGKDIFREVLIEAFIYGCPSNSLKSLIQERKSFSNLRGVMAAAIFNSNPEDDGGDPTTMSTGSSIAAFLDAQANEIESLDIIKSPPSLKLTENEGGLSGTSSLSIKSAEMDTLRERAVLLRRACRFRLYEGILLTLGSEIPGQNINIADMESISQNDIRMANSITLNDTIETAYSKVDFLMKVAENRLRDITLCGWDQWIDDQKSGEKNLESCICFFINEYLIEMVGILATVLESKTLRSSKGGGLQSKITLINIFVDNNDRLNKICESILRPYDLSCDPPPCLSAFLDIDTLIAFYADTLHDEMRQWVEGVVKIWKDKTKDAGGSSASYHFHLPWNPMRLKGKEGEIMSTIPEEVKAALEDYVRIARLDKDRVHDTFQKSFYLLDEKVAIAYCSSFLFLSHKYMEVLTSKDWGTSFDSNLSEEDRFNQQDEEIEWLCSVINDCFRINANSLMIPDESSKKKKKKKDESNHINKDLSYVIADTVQAFDFICIMCVDSVVCSLLNREDLNIHSLFKRELSNICIAELFEQLNSSAQKSDSTINDAGASNPSSNLRVIGLCGHKDGIIEFVKSFSHLLHGMSEFLSNDAYVRLVACCVDKVVILYLFLLREVYESHYSFTPDCEEFKQIKRDVDKLKTHFSKVTPTLYVETLMRHFHVLDQIVLLIGADINDIKPTILELQHEAEGNPGLAESIATMINFCLELRSDCHEITTIKRRKNFEAKDISHTRRKTFMGMFTSSANEKRSRSVSPAPQAKSRSSSPARDANNTTQSSVSDTSKHSDDTHKNSVMSYFRRKSKDLEVDKGIIEKGVAPEQVIIALENEENEEEKTNNAGLGIIESPLMKIMDSFNELIDDIRSEYDDDILDEDIQISKLKPIYSVFSSDARISSLTLSEILFKSSSTAVHQKLKMVSRNKNVASNSKRLFSWGLDNKNVAKNNDNAPGKVAAPKLTRSLSALSTLVISEVRVVNLFGLESLRQPKFSIEFQIKGSLSENAAMASTKTTILSNFNPSWTEKYILQYDHGAENELICNLIYSWMVSGDECIGTVTVPLRKLDFKSMRDVYPIEFTSNKAKLKADAYIKEKREPSLSLHLEIA